MTSVHRIHQERAYLNRGKHRRLDEGFRECARLYNAALEEWRTAYRQAGVGRTYHDQAKELTAIRAEDPYWGSVSIQVGRGVLRRLDRARRAFFRRVRAGEKPGYPKFRASRRWKTIEIAEPTASMVTSRRGKWVVRIKGLPVMVIKPIRELPDSSAIRTLTISRKPIGVYVSIGYAIERESLPQPTPSTTAVGLDMGVAARITLSDGRSVGRRSTDGERVAHLQRRISRCRRGSNNRRKLVGQFARLRHREQVRNRNECHRVTTDLIREYGLIAVEDLSIRNMTRSEGGTVEEPGTNVKAKSGLNRSILDQSWGVLVAQLTYKAGWYGRTVVGVDPRGTSQTCSRCGHRGAANRRGRRFACVNCGLRMDADHNAAINILDRAMAGGTSPSARGDGPEKYAA